MNILLRSQAVSFSRLQSELLSWFSTEFPGAIENFLLSVPKHGELMAGTSKWTFQKHGLGVRFTETKQGLVIDAHKFYAGVRSPIDAWRFLQYLESTGVVGLTERSVDAELAALVKEGFLCETPHACVYEVHESERSPQMH